jgi:hypothetical protein
MEFLRKLVRIFRGAATAPVEKISVGIDPDEPIEVSPGKFVTANNLARGALGAEELDQQLIAQAAENPGLAKALEAFGWKDGKPQPGSVPVARQIANANWEE